MNNLKESPCIIPRKEKKAYLKVFHDFNFRTLKDERGAKNWFIFVIS